MKNNYNNILFLSLLEKYRKYFSKLNKKIKNGSFSQMAAHERNALMKKVEQLRMKLEGFQSNTLKYAAAAALTLTIGAASAQGPFVRNDAKNPFKSTPVGSTSVVTFTAGDYEIVQFADLDNDGDLDVVAGNDYTFKYFKNNGTVSSPIFQDQTGTLNPLNGLSVNSYATPTLGDFDNDGDYDMVSGENNGALRYFRNIGTVTAPLFSELIGTLSPLNGFSLGDELVPFAVDIDNDGDLDLMVGEEDQSQVIYLKNTGNIITPVFTQQTGTFNPFSAINPIGTYRSNPTFVDIDNDGDYDAFIGENGSGTIHFFRNTGTAAAPAFTRVTGTLNPVSAFKINTYNYLFPSFADIDNDGDQDLFIGGEGSVQYFPNTGNATTPNFGLSNPGVNVSTVANASLSIVDIDNDGDKDAFVGNDAGGVLYYKNSGTVSAPVVTNTTGTLNPLNAVNLSKWSTISNVDLDNDGDKDAVISGYYSELVYYKNTGNASTPVFTAQTGTLNPLPAVSGYGINVELADIDNDGDQDLLVGDLYSNLYFYKNTGTATTPVFTLTTGTSSPFNAVAPSGVTAPALADVDGDADLDLTIGSSSGAILYYRNNGTASAPNFAQLTGTFNPFNSTVVVNPGNAAKPEFWDLDNDGDKDLFIGLANGTILMYENNAIVTSIMPGAAYKNTSVEVFPNPTSGAFTLSIPAELSGSAVVSLTDLSGREIFSESRELNEGELSYENLLNQSEPGVYVLKIVMDNRVGVAKIVKH